MVVRLCHDAHLPVACRSLHWLSSKSNPTSLIQSTRRQSVLPIFGLCVLPSRQMQPPFGVEIRGRCYCRGPRQSTRKPWRPTLDKCLTATRTDKFPVTGVREVATNTKEGIPMATSVLSWRRGQDLTMTTVPWALSSSRCIQGTFAAPPPHQ